VTGILNRARIGVSATLLGIMLGASGAAAGASAHPITATAGTTGAVGVVRQGNSPSIRISPRGGFPGMRATVQGDTFARNETVTIYFNGGNVVTTSSSTSGSFSATFKIPFNATVGLVDVAAVGSTGTLANANFFTVF
jgi:hypothetical protein